MVRDAERALGLNNAYVEYLEWSDAEKTKRTKELEKKYQDVLDLNREGYAEAQKEVVENLDVHLTCLDHLCNGKLCNGPINLDHLCNDRSQ